MESMDRLTGKEPGVVPEEHPAFMECKDLQRLVIFTIGICLVLLSIQPVYSADIGSKVDNFQLPDTAGTIHSLRSSSGKIVVLFFWSFKCPVSLFYNERFNALKDKYKNSEVVIWGVDSATNETPAEILANIANMKITTPVLLDLDGNVAEKMGASQTPSVFVIDGNRILSYRGALDNNRKAGEQERIAYVEDAIDALIAGRAVPVSETQPFGCSIRRKEIRE
jgi:peroxiredoxin